MTLNRAFLKIVAAILFILAAVFLVIVPSIRTNIDLALISVGLACWALA